MHEKACVDFKGKYRQQKKDINVRTLTNHELNYNKIRSLKTSHKYLTRSGERLKLFKREIYDADLLKAVMVTIMAIVLVFISLLIITLIEPYSLEALLVEVTSAFGTVGLSLGI